MVNIKSVNEIILSLIDFYRAVEPDLDTKPGTVARDLFIEAPASQLSLLYEELSKIADLQSLRTVIGSDLDRIAQNFGALRSSATKSSGLALLTFNSIPTSIPIEKGSLVFSAGTSFSVINGLVVNPTQLNFYRSVATKYKTDLDFIGIKDQYAVEVTVQATVSGVLGNISKYSLNGTNISGVSNVSNVRSFSGGADQEDDASFRNRVLSIFSGSNVGTSLGYKNTVLSDNQVLDAIVVEPGDPLMTRDGTQVTKDNKGNITIVSEGNGGKVDIVILGSALTEYLDSFIYKDLSNTSDPTSKKNIIVLGQIQGDVNKTINKKRIDNLITKVLPAQPVEDILEVTGSISGSNFKPKTIDTYGRVSGNYELIKDSGNFGGSPWGFDSFHWISDKISLFDEDRIKGKINGQDNLTFTDVLEIPEVEQNLSITNENSIVTNADRSVINLIHTPATNITRVFNTNTGERYTITDQNPNGSGSINTSGQIKITGNTLPAPSDVLQVDYTWITTYDQFIDYDGRVNTNNPRTVTESVDWGYSNAIRNEKTLLVKNTASTFYVATLIHPISSIVSVNLYSQLDSIVYTVASGNFAGRLAIDLNHLIIDLKTIDSIKFKSSNVEIYNTDDSNGTFISTRISIGIDIRYNIQIILSTDSPAIAGKTVTVKYNSSDVFNVNASTGNFNNTQVTIPIINISPITSASVISCDVNYIANVQDVVTTAVTNLPLVRISNGFGSEVFENSTNGYISNVMRREAKTLALDLSSNLYIKLGVSTLDTVVTASDIFSIIRISDGLELWNKDNTSTFTIETDNTYKITFGSFNTPAVNNQVLVIYYGTDIKRYQPTTFQNKIFNYSFQSLQKDISTGKFYCSIFNFITESSIHFSIIDPITNVVIISESDGVLTSVTDTYTGTLTSFLGSFNSIENITNYKLKISNAVNSANNGTYDINSYNSITQTITLKLDVSSLTNKSISLLRLSDGKDLWSSAGVIDIPGNTLYMPATTIANQFDQVILVLFNSKPLKQAPSRLSVTTSDSNSNSGVLTIKGLTLTKVTEVIFTAGLTGLKQNINNAIRKSLGLTSAATLPTNVSLAKIAKLEKVNTIVTGDFESVIATYDLKNTTLNNCEIFANEFQEDSTLGKLDFVLANTENNIKFSPTIGDKLRITFYYTTTDDTENIFFTRNGTLYTNKCFAEIQKIYISSGFSSSQSLKFTISTMNQPITGSRYKSFYDYTAPKPNERIIVRFNYNKLVSDATFNLESSRPINADVIIRQAKQVLIDVTINIVVTDSFKNSGESLVKQNVKDRMISAINSNKLGGILDSSDLINTVYSVEGVDRARVLAFNKTQESGQLLSVKCQSDEYFVANNITVNIETR